MVRIERVEAELKKKQALHKKCQESNDLNLLKDLRMYLTQKLSAAEEVASFGARAGLLALRSWDKIALIMVLAHMCMIVMAYSRKVSSIDSDPFKWILVLFPFYYCFEIGNRAWQHGGIEKFLKNPEKPTLQFMHKVDCFVSFVSLFCTIAMLIVALVGSESPRLLEMLANVSVIRILVLHRPFRHLLYSCMTGLGPLRMYLVLMVVVYYYFSLAASHFFRDMGLEYNFDGLADSLLTMHQVFLGEGWNQMMGDAHASNLNPAVYVFFIVFYLIMAILFTQLFAGIIINLFLRSEEWRSKGGSIYVLLGSINPFLASRTQDELEHLVHDLSELQVLMSANHWDFGHQKKNGERRISMADVVSTNHIKSDTDVVGKMARKWLYRRPVTADNVTEIRLPSIEATGPNFPPPPASPRTPQDSLPGMPALSRNSSSIAEVVDSMGPIDEAKNPLHDSIETLESLSG